MTRIIVFAKAPVPGTVKTRLAARLGPEAAARVHEVLVDRTLAMATPAAPGQVELCVAPDLPHPFFRACQTRFGVSLSGQGDGDLGARMYRAIARAVPRGPVVLIGTDCPAMDGPYLRSALAALEESSLVIGPAEDGGYVLIGARGAIDPWLFDGIVWGGSGVLAATRERIARLRIRHTELPVLWDVDVPADYERWQALEKGAA